MGTRLERWAVGGALVGGAALALRAFWFEPRRGVVRRRTLRLPRWPRELDGLRLALVSDLHAGAPHVDEDRVSLVARRVTSLRPHLVALLGDYLDNDVALATPVAPEAIAERLGAIEAPLGVYAVLGNQDWEHAGTRMPRGLGAAGVTVLEDEAVPVAGAPAPLWVAGLADPTTRDPSVAHAFAEVPGDAAVIALSHDPDLFPHVPERVALTVSGHTHGGQVDIPLVRRLFIPSRHGDRYRAGHVEERGRHLFVTRGVGTSRLPVRFRSPPEIVVLRLRSATSG